MVDGTLEPNAGRVAIDALKWSASKLKPREYGDRSQVDMKGEVKYAPVTAEPPTWFKKAIEASSREAAQEAENIHEGTSTKHWLCRELPIARRFTQYFDQRRGVNGTRWHATGTRSGTHSVDKNPKQIAAYRGWHALARVISLLWEVKKRKKNNKQ